MKSPRATQKPKALFGSSTFSKRQTLRSSVQQPGLVWKWRNPKKIRRKIYIFLIYYLPFAFFFLYFGAMSGSSSGVCVPPYSSSFAGCSRLDVKSRAPRRQQQQQQPSLDHSCEGKNCSPGLCYIHSHTHSSRGLHRARDLLGPILVSLPSLLCCPRGWIFCFWQISLLSSSSPSSSLEYQQGVQ